jgi:hypothetical protein
MANKKRCKCGAIFNSDDRTLCMECYCSRFNRPVGQRQADPVDRKGNPDAILAFVQPCRDDTRSYNERLAEGFAAIGGDNT